MRRVVWVTAWTLIILVISWGPLFFSENSGPREPENKTETTSHGNPTNEPVQESSTPLHFWSERFRPIINIYTAKHPDEESKCPAAKNWKEWGSFAWCRTVEWADTDRIIAVFTIVLAL